MKRIVLVVFISIIFYSGGSLAQNENDMKKLEWIVENWVSADSELRSYERWEKSSDGLFTGSSQTIKNGDTIFSESLNIERTEDGIFYIADVKHNPAPVKFKLTEISESKAVFENPGHDFPQKISYELTEGNLHAWIEGPGKDGKWKKIDFLMTKMR